MQDSTKINEISIDDIIKMYHATDSGHTYNVTYDNSLVMSHSTNLENESILRSHFTNPTRILFSCVFLCVKGNALIHCNSREYHIQPNTIFVCKPGSVVQFVNGHINQISSICSVEQPEGAISLSLQKLLPHYTELEAMTVLRLSAHESKRLNTMMGFLKEAILADHDLLFYHEAIKAQIHALIFSMLNTFCSGLNLKKSSQHTAHHRQQDYVRRFMSLLNLHFREQRRVTFYSDMLHITAKYLGTIVTQQTGHTVSEWIDRLVISEAKVLLSSSSLTIQEITYKLNFPNQSFFCKYFKSHTGITPSEFRSHGN